MEILLWIAGVILLLFILKGIHNYRASRITLTDANPTIVAKNIKWYLMAGRTSFSIKHDIPVLDNCIDDCTYCKYSDCPLYTNNTILKAIKDSDINDKVHIEFKGNRILINVIE